MSGGGIRGDGVGMVRGEGHGRMGSSWVGLGIVLKSSNIELGILVGSSALD